jgi:hypothetical protein
MYLPSSVETNPWQRACQRCKTSTPMRGTSGRQPARLAPNISIAMRNPSSTKPPNSCYRRMGALVQSGHPASATIPPRLVHCLSSTMGHHGSMAALRFGVPSYETSQLSRCPSYGASTSGCLPTRETHGSYCWCHSGKFQPAVASPLLAPRKFPDGASSGCAS